MNYAHPSVIYLTIRRGNAYVKLRFAAATSSMSRLFVESTSIHDTFRRILIEAQGVLGQIDLGEGYECLPLESPELRYVPQLKEKPDDLPEVDLMVLAALETLPYQRKQWRLQGDPRGFYDRWVHPFRDINSWYLRPSAEDMKEILLSALQDDSPSDETLTLLFEDSHPGYQAAACWFVGLHKLRKWKSTVQKQFRAWPINTAAFFALTRLGENIGPQQIQGVRLLPGEEERMVQTMNALVSLMAKE